MGCALSIDELEFPFGSFTTTWAQELAALRRSIAIQNAIESSESSVRSDSGIETRRMIVGRLVSTKRATTLDIASAIGLSTTAVRSHLNKLVRANIVLRINVYPVAWELAI